MIAGSIYSVRSKSRPELVYYGSTTQRLCNRMCTHRSAHKAYTAGRGRFCTSFTVLDCGDAYIELVEAVEVPSKEHMRAIEGRYQREFPCVNKNRAGRTQAEYMQEPAHIAAQRANERRYKAKPASKLLAAAYEQTPEVKARRAAYRASPEGKAARAAWLASPQGVAAMKASRERANLKKSQNKKEKSV